MGGVRKVWTEDDEARLRAMMTIRTKWPAMAAALSRSQGSVIARANKLGIKPGREPE
jgi:hypothetical protein